MAGEIEQLKQHRWNGEELLLGALQYSHIGPCLPCYDMEGV